MAKLPDNDTLRKFYRDGISNKEIAAAFDVTIQAVNWRLSKMGLQRKPETFTATAILEAAYPTSKDFKRSEFTQLQRARELFCFIRWRLGDKTLSDRQLHMAERFCDYSRARDVVLALDPAQEKSPWVWLPREPADGQLVLRWPADREKPKGAHLEAISLPEPEAGLVDAPMASIGNL
ncbi:hypothetical protein ACFFUA_01510 [Streptomyces heliomycini]|uniref:Uncharacterized protein n=1 Tax=Streptomyces heliomycini TaxID=284032 RepID=A0ABV5L1Y5_9ACTN